MLGRHSKELEGRPGPNLQVHTQRLASNRDVAVDKKQHRHIIPERASAWGDVGTRHAGDPLPRCTGRRRTVLIAAFRRMLDKPSIASARHFHSIQRITFRNGASPGRPGPVFSVAMLLQPILEAVQETGDAVATPLLQSSCRWSRGRPGGVGRRTPISWTRRGGVASRWGIMPALGPTFVVGPL